MTVANEVVVEEVGGQTERVDFWAEVQAVDLSTTPQEILDLYKMEEGDTVVGQASEMTCRLTVVSARTTKKLFDAEAEIMRKGREHLASHADPSHNRLDCDAFHRELDLLVKEVSRLEELALIIKEMFWASLKLDFPELIGKQGIFLADGWKAGYQKEPMKSSDDDVKAGILKDLLRALGTHR